MLLHDLIYTEAKLHKHTRVAVIQPCTGHWATRKGAAGLRDLAVKQVYRTPLCVKIRKAILHTCSEGATHTETPPLLPKLANLSSEKP